MFEMKNVGAVENSDREFLETGLVWVVLVDFIFVTFIRAFGCKVW